MGGGGDGLQRLYGLCPVQAVVLTQDGAHLLCGDVMTPQIRAQFGGNIGSVHAKRSLLRYRSRRTTKRQDF